jgi:ABC-type transport system substrate-binding protein
MMTRTDEGEGVGIFSKKAADEMGPDWMRENIIGTGPFEMDKWVEHEGIFVKAAPGKHWKKAPYVERVSILEVPDASIRLAMLETGEAQIAVIDLTDRAGLLNTGKFAMSPVVGESNYMIMWSGQYWDRVHYITGAPLDYVVGGTRWADTSMPWIGDPYENFVGTPTVWREGYDETTPSMVNSRLVRHALSMAIDRDTINETILDGLGRPSYVGWSYPDDPVLKANADRWHIPYDIETAMDHMQQAGYPDVFSMPWWIGPVGTFGMQTEISEAVAASWQTHLNVEVEFDRQPYASFRPLMITRTLRYPQARQGAGGPSTRPTEWLNSSAVPNGYNNGIETPVNTEVFYQKMGTVDFGMLEELTETSYDYNHYWRLYTGIALEKAGYIYNTDKVKVVKMRPAGYTPLGGISQLEWLRLRK